MEIYLILTDVKIQRGCWCNLSYYSNVLNQMLHDSGSFMNIDECSCFCLSVFLKINGF